MSIRRHIAVANDFVVHITSLRDADDDVSQADIMHDFEEAAGHGSHFTIHITREHSAATVPIPRRLALR